MKKQDFRKLIVVRLAKELYEVGYDEFNQAQLYGVVDAVLDEISKMESIKHNLEFFKNGENDQEFTKSIIKHTRRMRIKND